MISSLISITRTFLQGTRPRLTRPSSLPIRSGKPTSRGGYTSLCAVAWLADHLFDAYDRCCAFSQRCHGLKRSPHSSMGRKGTPIRAPSCLVGEMCNRSTADALSVAVAAAFAVAVAFNTSCVDGRSEEQDFVHFELSRCCVRIFYSVPHSAELSARLAVFLISFGLSYWALCGASFARVGWVPTTRRSPRPR